MLFSLIIGFCIFYFFNHKLKHTNYVFYIITCLFIFSSILKQTTYSKIFSSIFLHLCIIYGSIFLSQLKQRQIYDKNIAESSYHIACIKGPLVEKKNSFSSLIEINKYKLANTWKEANIKTIIYFEKSEKIKQLNFGDSILFNSRLRRISNKNNPFEFNIKNYQLSNGIAYNTYVKSENLTILSKRDKLNSIRAIGISIRLKLSNIFKKANMSHETIAILNALCLGDKSMVNNNLKQSWMNAGVIHILAVSGLHLGIIYIILNFILKIICFGKNRNIYKALILICGIWLYALITGLAPSVSRSALMFSILILGEIFDRDSNIYNSICLSAIILIIINPFIILSVGFQFSYLAVISIVYYFPKLKSIFNFRNKIISYLSDMILVSISAQFLTLGLSLFYFGKFPSYFILSSIIIIPFAGILIYSSILLFLTSDWTWAFNIISKFLDYIVYFINYVINQIEDLPYSSIKSLHIDKYQLVFLSLFIILCCAGLIYHRIRLIIFSFLFLVCFQALLLNHKLSEHLYILDSKETTILHSNNNNNICYIDSTKISGNDFILSSLNQSTNIKYKHMFDYELFSFRGKNLLVFNNKSQIAEKLIQKLQPEYIVFSNNSIYSIKNHKLLKDREIILSRNCWKGKRLMKKLNELRINIIDISKKGAFKLE
ncbi:MAG: ComEC family competence protein [Marinifilaceae bacterium]|nr:ComEC family competence protein [Marinifilaceae bacterium]